jgi:hypothetical protein
MSDLRSTTPQPPTPVAIKGGYPVVRHYTSNLTSTMCQTVINPSIAQQPCTCGALLYLNT